MLPILIPSRSRWTTVGTLIKQFPPNLFDTIRVYVPESQRSRYERAVQPHPGVVIITLSDELRMAGVRDFMGKDAWKRREKIFLMVDDDVRFERRVDDLGTLTRACEPEDVRDLLVNIEKRLLDGRWGQVGIPPRQFQNGIPPGPPDSMLRECTRNMCVTGWRTGDFLRVDYTRCAVRSDFDATLQLLRLGRPNLNLCFWQHSSKGNNTPGGCADYRTTELANAEAERLASLHPGFVTLVKKKYEAQAARKNNNMGERIEVMVRWKAAYESGCK